MLPVVPSMTATPAGANYFHVPFQGMLPATTSLTSQTSNSVPVSSWTTTTWENPHDDWVSTPGSNYKLRLDATPWNSHTAFESFSTVPRAVWHPHRQPLAPVATSSFEHNSYDPLNPLSAIQSFTRPSDAGHVSHHSSLPDTENTNPFAPPTLPRRHSLTPPLPYQGPQPSSSVQTLSDGRPYFGIYHPAQKAAPPPRRKRPARAIEYDGFWIDEEELLKGLTAPDGKISVHECHWGEHHSPCHLWIRGDKSCIGSHIQKWHGGKPGGDKLEADCLWSTCRKTMLKESVSRHVVSIHLGEKWKCQGCREEFTRKDAYGRHVEKASKEECRNAGALIMYDADSRVVDARTALASGGRQRYADA
ncbi:hypothetical protein BS17DRAFT_185545 [Gyrodon lividus]|nr:hypothetical protein BS17DRAFT_185545 [Gyrodon lividus]